MKNLSMTDRPMAGWDMFYDYGIQAPGRQKKIIAGGKGGIFNLI
jgi:hypothetical protein